MISIRRSMAKRIAGRSIRRLKSRSQRGRRQGRLIGGSENVGSGLVACGGRTDGSDGSRLLIFVQPATIEAMTCQCLSSLLNDHRCRNRLSPDHCCRSTSARITKCNIDQPQNGILSRFMHFRYLPVGATYLRQTRHALLAGSVRSRCRSRSPGLIQASGSCPLIAIDKDQ
jgi:hypothetical protein